ncbi:MAG TPA: thiamine-phosphate kinase [Terriglobia bacterium]|nr:thiamine-phosphate kinase [Terriglobia bacterium]
MSLKNLGEDGLIRRLRSRFPGPRAGLGIGDDTAILEFPAGHQILYCSDLVVENTHFICGMHPPDSVGYKAVAVNISDVGAMGGIPMFLLVSIALPADLEAAWVDSFYDGVERACREFDVALVGGDSSSSERIFVDVSMIGRVLSGKAVRRSGARPGDAVYVTGSLGGSAAGLEALQRGQTPDCMLSTVLRHLYPAPRHRVGASLAGPAHAMIDISDGLSTDLGHIATESQVSIRIYKDRIPVFPGAGERHALHGGEEYELIVVAADDLPSSVEGVPLTRIGEVVDSSPEAELLLVDETSGPEGRPFTPRGWQHF